MAKETEPESSHDNRDDSEFRRFFGNFEKENGITDSHDRELDITGLSGT